MYSLPVLERLPSLTALRDYLQGAPAGTEVLLRKMFISPSSKHWSTTVVKQPEFWTSCTRESSAIAHTRSELLNASASAHQASGLDVNLVP
jgi:hypothetical protein